MMPPSIPKAKIHLFLKLKVKMQSIWPLIILTSSIKLKDIFQFYNSVPIYLLSFISIYFTG